MRLLSEKAYDYHEVDKLAHDLGYEHGYVSTEYSEQYTGALTYDLFTAVRELVQNALDEMQETTGKPSFNWKYDPSTRTLEIWDTGRGVKLKHLLLRWSDKPKYTRGHYGSGLKIATTTFARYGATIEVVSRHIKKALLGITPIKLAGETLNLFVVLYTPAKEGEEPFKGTKFTVRFHKDIPELRDIPDYMSKVTCLNYKPVCEQEIYLDKFKYKIQLFEEPSDRIYMQDILISTFSQLYGKPFKYSVNFIPIHLYDGTMKWKELLSEDRTGLKGVESFRMNLGDCIYVATYLGNFCFAEKLINLLMSGYDHPAFHVLSVGPFSGSLRPIGNLDATRNFLTEQARKLSTSTVLRYDVTRKLKSMFGNQKYLVNSDFAKILHERLDIPLSKFIFDTWNITADYGTFGYWVYDFFVTKLGKEEADRLFASADVSTTSSFYDCDAIDKLIREYNRGGHIILYDWLSVPEKRRYGLVKAICKVCLEIAQHPKLKPRFYLSPVRTNMPSIKIYSPFFKKEKLGHCIPAKNEIAIARKLLSAPITEIVKTVAHEMAHWIYDVEDKTYAIEHATEFLLSNIYLSTKKLARYIEAFHRYELGKRKTKPTARIPKGITDLALATLMALGTAYVLREE